MAISKSDCEFARDRYLAVVAALPEVKDRTAEEMDLANSLDDIATSLERQYRKQEEAAYWKRQAENTASVRAAYPHLFGERA